jgi:preprotein translocase subunit SecA
MSAAGDMLSFDADAVRERDIVRSLGGVHLVGLGLRDTQRADERFTDVIDAAAHGSTVQHVFVNGSKSVKALSDALTARVAYEKEQEITRMRDLTYQSISDSQREIITWDRQRLLLSGSLLNLVETGAQEAADWVASEADPNHPEGVLQVVNSFVQTDLVASDVSGALSDGTLGGLVGEKFATWAREAWAATPIGDADRVARGVALAVVDRKWAEHYRFLVELRQGIGYRRYAKLTPNIEFAKEADEAFNRLHVSIAVETFGFAAHRLAGAEVLTGS